MSKFIITIVLAVVSIVGTNLWQSSSHDKQMQATVAELQEVQAQLNVARLELAVTKVDLAASNAVIDRQNTLIAAQEYKLQEAKRFGTAKIASIQQDSNRWRTKVAVGAGSARPINNDETITAINAHLVRFSNE
jgi:hypothetical protein